MRQREQEKETDKTERQRGDREIKRQRETGAEGERDKERNK